MSTGGSLYRSARRLTPVVHSKHHAPLFSQNFCAMRTPSSGPDAPAAAMRWRSVSGMVMPGTSLCRKIAWRVL